MNTDPDTAIDNESAVIAEANAEAEAAKAVVAAPEVVPEVAAAPVVEATPDPVLAAIAAQTEATRALAEKLVAQQAAPEPVVVAEVPRDFDAELAAAKTEARTLAQQYEEGEIDAAKYEAEKDRLEALRDSISDDRAEARIEAKLNERLKASAEQTAAEAKANDELAWKTASDAFMADPGNAALVDDQDKRDIFGVHLNIVARANPGISYPEMLVKARERITGVAAIDPNKAIRDAEFARNKEARIETPTTLRDVPNAGDNDNSPEAALDNLGISELEDRLMLMTEAQRKTYRETAPGGLRDNPRYTG